MRADSWSTWQRRMCSRRCGIAGPRDGVTLIRAFQRRKSMEPKALALMSSTGPVTNGGGLPVCE